ncbi:MAG: nickel pincer cofactor biosynthesis protein LarC [Planctomycetes bacterium]|nr:nickel pincer cofactor biosynthesis protein LarC [Planctomycetota bacterium]
MTRGSAVRYGYFDCFGGAAGDMILGALIDAGCPIDVLQDVLARLKLPGVTLAAEKVKRHGLAATLVHVKVGPAARTRERHLPEIIEIIERAQLPPTVAARAADVFKRLAQAEAAAHGLPEDRLDKVHFHEVGAADALVDIVCGCAGVHEMGLARLGCSPIPVGHGQITCAHGVLPVPAPATANLLKGFPLAASPAAGEWCTPTGAAMLTTLVPAADFAAPPALRLDAVGVGAGTREMPDRPNVLRLLVGETGAVDECGQDRVCVLEAEVDDATGQSLAYACERLLEAAALDAYIVPIIMKKGRPGQLLTVLGRPADVAALETIVFRETTTLGVRRYECARTRLPREHVRVETRFGPIRVKTGRHADTTTQAWPEYDDCAAAAGAHGVALRVVQDEALRVWATTGGAKVPG